MKKIQFSVIISLVFIIVFCDSKIARAEGSADVCSYSWNVNVSDRVEAGPKGIQGYSFELYCNQETGYVKVSVGEKEYSAKVDEKGIFNCPFDEEYEEGTTVSFEVYCKNDTLIGKDTISVAKDMVFTSSYGTTSSDCLKSPNNSTMTQYSTVLIYPKYAYFYYDSLSNDKFGTVMCFENKLGINNKSIKTISYQNVGDLYIEFDNSYKEGDEVSFWIENPVTGRKGKVWSAVVEKSLELTDFNSKFNKPQQGDKGVELSLAGNGHYNIQYVPCIWNVKVNDKCYNTSTTEVLSNRGCVTVPVDELKPGDKIVAWVTNTYGEKSNEISYTIPHDHSCSNWAVDKEASCTEGGSMSGICDICGASMDKTVPSLGHKWDNGVVTKPATKTEEGIRTYKCETCKITKTETIEKLYVEGNLEENDNSTHTDAENHGKENVTDNKKTTFERKGSENITLTTDDDKMLRYKLVIGNQEYNNDCYDDDGYYTDEDGESYYTDEDDDNDKSYYIEWKSGNSKIATVSKTGLVTAKKMGVTTITARHKESGQTITWKITVKEDYAECTTNNKTININPYIKHIKNYKKIKWKSSNKKVIKIKWKKFYVKGKGKTYITGKANGIKYKLEIVVKNPKAKKQVKKLTNDEKKKIKDEARKIILDRTRYLHEDVYSIDYIETYFDGKKWYVTYWTRDVLGNYKYHSGEFWLDKGVVKFKFTF